MLLSKKFSELLEASIRKYQNRAIETTQIIMELIELAKEISEAEKRGEASGLTPDELAFYDALADNEYYQKLVPEEVRNEVEELSEMIVNGEIKVDDSFGKSNEEIQAIKDSVK